LDKLQTFSQNLSFTETVDGSADEVASLKDQLKGFSTALTVYDEKLSMLIEGSVRRVVQIEKGEEWVKGFTIGVLRRPFLSWISELPTHRISMSVNHWHPKPALNPETSKKE
jgi:hypothetical protein